MHGGKDYLNCTINIPPSFHEKGSVIELPHITKGLLFSRITSYGNLEEATFEAKCN